MTLSISDGAALLRRIRDQIATRVVGQDAAIDDALVAILARGHLLIEGVPGTAKTLLARAIAAAADAGFARIQFTPDLMPADITGVSTYRDPARGFEFQPGPVFTDILLADEINRAPARTQAALLEAMAERQVTSDGVTRALDPLFTVIATQNPVEHEGTFPLPEAQLDRFLVKIVIDYPTLAAERAMLDLHADGFDPERDATLFPAVCTRDELRAARDLVDGVRLAADVRDYITAVTRATRDDPALSLGASPRATVSLMRAARASAVLDGRDYVVPDDVKGRAPSVLRHRITLAPEVEIEGRTADEVLDGVLARVAAPA